MIFKAARIDVNMEKFASGSRNYFTAEEVYDEALDKHESLTQYAEAAGFIQKEVKEVKPPKKISSYAAQLREYGSPVIKDEGIC